MNKKVVLLSGGLDSTVLIHKLKNDGNDIRAIYINLGYLSSLGELHSVKYTTNTLGIPFEIVNLEGLADMLAGFYSPDIIRSIEYDTGSQPEPEPEPGDDDLSNLSGYYILTSIASFYAQLSGCSYLDVGVLKEQSENRNFMNVIQQLSNIVSTFNPNHELIIEAPFTGMYKEDVVKLGSNLQIDMSKTWSCYKTGSIQCGVCKACRQRREAFSKAGVPDNTRYEN